MSKRISYPLSGADRFQLYFDSVARKSTGIGNVIRAAVTLDGIISEDIIRRGIEENEWIGLISGLTLRKNYFSSTYRFESESGQNKFAVSFHDGTYKQVLEEIEGKDCNLSEDTSFYADVVYENNKTHMIFSVSHILMDHAGIENLLSTFSGETNLVAFAASSNQRTVLDKLSDSISATLFVSSLNSWSMKRLAGTGKKRLASFEVTELNEQETLAAKNYMTKQMHAGALPFFLGCSLQALRNHSELLTGKNYFVPVPLDRRVGANQNSLLSNFISFLYFKAKESDLESIEKLTKSISTQTILQAKKNLPDKFSSLLDMFRFIPARLYKTFIDLPSKGHAATFAFSLLSNSKLEGKKIFGKNVLDITHYAPVISPPGLNVIFNEFNGRLKILCSFDESRIARKNVVAYMTTLKQNLLG